VKFKRQIAGLAAALFIFAAVAAGQNAKHESQLRSVHGIVTDKSETPMPGAVVFLKNTRTNVVRSNIAEDETGSYKFSGLDPNSDYEIHAEKDGANSSTRTISSFESRKEIVVNLKIGPKKG
jgi:hypothetical protein